MIGTSWSSNEPMRVKCIHRCFFASSCRWLWAPLTGGVAVSRLVAMLLSPFRDGYPIWTKLLTLRRNRNRAQGESQPPGAVQIVQPTGRRFGDSAYCTAIRSPVGWPHQPSGWWGEGHLDEPIRTDGPDIHLDGVTKRFADTTAVDRLTLSIERGAFYAMLGPSGCGKTTTLRMIGGFEDPSEGTVYLGGSDVTDLPPYRRDVNTVFQSYALFPHLDVQRNVAFGLERRKVGRDDVRRRVADALELTQLTGYERRKPSQLSGGQQQRVALARALVNRPRALLLDEPLGALDLRLRKQLQIELKRIQKEVGITFVHVTHDQEEAMTMADEIAVMNEGHIEQAGSATELYETPRTEFVASFLGDCNLIDGALARRGGGAADFETHDGAHLRVASERID